MTREPRQRDGRRPLLGFAAMRRNLVALGLGLALLAGCGDDDDARQPAGADLNAVRCPMVPTGEVESTASSGSSRRRTRSTPRS